MSLLAWLVIGALAGWVASMVLGQNHQMGWLANIGLGIAGALVGGLIMRLIGGSGFSGFNIYSLLVAVGGATLVLFVVTAIQARAA